MKPVPTISIRKIPDEVHRALKVRAAHHGRSTEAEVRSILENAVTPKANLASALTAIGKRLGGIEFELTRDKRPYKPVVFK